MAVTALAEVLRKRKVQVFVYEYELDQDGSKIRKALTSHRNTSVILALAFGSQVLKQAQFIRFFRSLAKDQRPGRDVITLRLETQPPSIPEERTASTVGAAFDLSPASNYDNELDRLVAHLGAVVEREAKKRTDRYSHVSGVLEATVPQSKLFADLQSQIQTGSVDQKYLYWDVRAALRWQEIAEASTYMTAQTSMNILAAHASEMLAEFKRASEGNCYTFINFGVGTGVKDYLIIEQMLKADNDARLLYVPIDESLPMLHITLLQMQELMGQYGDRLRIHFVLDDFENADRFSRHITQEEQSWFGSTDTSRLVGFLGGSIGNFDERKILAEIKQLMPGPCDRMLLGVEYIGGRSNQELSSNYEDLKMKQFLYGPIFDVEGVAPDWARDFRNEVRNDRSDVPQSRTIVGWAKHAQSEIKLFTATKYNREQFELFLKSDGWAIEASYSTDDDPPKFGKYILKLENRKAS